MNLSNISFAEKTGIITGGTQGIGYAIAEQFVTMGGRAVLIGRNEEKGRAATEKLGNASFYSLDLNVCDKIPHVFRQIIADEKRIDILINNAGIEEAEDARRNESPPRSGTRGNFQHRAVPGI